MIFPTSYNGKLLQDVFFHFAKLKGDFARHKIENNKNLLLVYAMNDFNEKIELIEEIIKSYDNHNFKSLTNEINLVFLNDPELHRVNVIITKGKYLPQIDKSKTALIIQTI